VAGDAMTLDTAGLLAEQGGGPWSLVSNLPYNLATPLVLRTLVDVPAVEHLLVMVQREVGERMAARVGDPAYGSVSVRVAYFARSTLAGRVPASVFIPRPRVESVLVRMERRSEVAVDPAMVAYPRLAAVVKAGFGQRRKMLRRSLAGVVEPEAFARAGVRPEARAEELTVEDWGRLAR
jgi:16S rRNA (adenine1518-N6/adenine1519-N6)-dimethyltransferase